VRLPILFNMTGSPQATGEGQRASLAKLLENAPGGSFVTLGPVIITGVAR